MSDHILDGTSIMRGVTGHGIMAERSRGIDGVQRWLNGIGTHLGSLARTVLQLVAVAILALLMPLAVAGCGSNPETGLFASGFEDCHGLPSGSTINVLWVGNSLTNTPPDMNDYSRGPLPERLAPMLAELGITLTYQAVIQGGAEFATHAANPQTMALIADPSFDAVNMQGYYRGFSSSSEFQDAVRPLYEAAHNAGSAALFEGLWPYINDPGSPQHPAAALAVEGAAENMPGAFAVQVGRAWARIKETDPPLYAKLYSDNTHQSVVGEYLNCLVYTRFFSAQSVQPITSISPEAHNATTSQERSQMKAAVDSVVTIFYTSRTNLQPTLKIVLPQSGQIFDAGDSVTFSATAIDVDGRALDSAIQWSESDGEILHTGSQFTMTLPVGRHVMKAMVQGAGGGIVSATREFTIASGVNRPPVATDKSQNIPGGSPFTQINLAANATDEDGVIDWTTLELDLGRYHGVSAVQNAVDLATVDVNYSNGFTGEDLIRWRVADDAGEYSNWASIHLFVQGG